MQNVFSAQAIIISYNQNSMAQRKKKIQEFRVSIRNRNLSQKLAQLRAKQQQTSPQITNAQQIIPLIRSIFQNSKILSLYEKMQPIKAYSNLPQVIKVLKQYFQGFYKLLVEVDNYFPSKPQKSNSIYNDICTILINITSIQSIDFKENIQKDIASPIFKNINNKQREIDTLWFMSNILFRKNKLSCHFMEVLNKNNIEKYILNRTNLIFQSKTDMTIFCYFMGAVAANLQFVQNYATYVKFLKVFEKQAELKIQQSYIYILDGLIVHANAFNKFKYQIFSTNLLKKCDEFCKNKKSRYIVKYLQIVLNFLKGEEEQILQANEDNRKKILNEQYERIKNKNIIKNLEFCLENRLPQVKALLLQVATGLLALYFKEIDLASQYLYITLAEQIHNAEKLDQKCSFKMLKYLQTLIVMLLKEGNLTKNNQYVDLFLKFLQGNFLFQKIEYFLEQFYKQNEILNVCFDILAYLQDYNLEELIGMLKKVRILDVLESLQIQPGELERKRSILVEFLHQRIPKQQNSL